eukprot:5473707-Prymnesium_polylepis.2
MFEGANARLRNVRGAACRARGLRVPGDARRVRGAAPGPCGVRAGMQAGTGFRLPDSLSMIGHVRETLLLG